MKFLHAIIPVAILTAVLATGACLLVMWILDIEPDSAVIAGVVGANVAVATSSVYARKQKERREEDARATETDPPAEPV